MLSIQKIMTSEQSPLPSFHKKKGLGKGLSSPNASLIVKKI